MIPIFVQPQSGDYGDNNNGEDMMDFGWMHRLYQSGELTGWAGGAMALLASFGAVAKLFGNISPTDLNSWLLFAASAILGGISVWSAVYHRLQKVRLDGEQYTACVAANLAAISAGKPIPYPQFLPKSSSAPAEPKSGEIIMQASTTSTKSS